MADARGTAAHLIINPAAGSAATLTESLTRAARERGIGMRLLEPGEDAMHAALEAAEEGAESLAVAGGDGGGWPGWPWSATCHSWWCPRARSTTSPAT